MHIRWRGLELPYRLEKDERSATPTFGRFTAEPFERGFGTTIGNSLRRTLLSSLEGAAITKVKIAGVTHEFSTMPGVLEDVTDIILNIKGLIVSMDIECDEPKTMRLMAEGPGEVTADLIEQMNANPAMKIEISGNNDELEVKASKENEEYLDLDRKRVAIAVKYFVAQGIAEDRIIKTYKGTSTPSSEIVEDDEQDVKDAKCRRVEFRVKM